MWSDHGADRGDLHRPRRRHGGRRNDIAAAIARADDGTGVIVLTDLFGGTPSNLAISLMKSERVEVIAGVNLPMLIRSKARARPWM
jgi:PTS system mannose-specific IIA component